MKKIIYLLVVFTLITSCKTSQKSIITTKKEAIKKSKYDPNVSVKNANLTVTKKENDTKKVEVLKKEDHKTINLENCDNDKIIEVDNEDDFINQLIIKAKDNIGSRYKIGGLDKNGFDCSGLIYATFKNFDIFLPRTSAEMSRTGVILSKNEAQKGDLIFFKTNGKTHINHVGMVVEVIGNEVKFIHASIHNGVMISSTNEAYYSKAFAQINRVIEK